MNQNDCSGKTLKLWPVFVDHYSWTFLGWLVCLVWSLSSNTQTTEVVENKNQNIAKKFFLVSADTKERIQGFYTDDGALKSIDENGFTISNASKNAEGGMDFMVEASK